MMDKFEQEIKDLEERIVEKLKFLSEYTYEGKLTSEEGTMYKSGESSEDKERFLNSQILNLNLVK